MALCGHGPKAPPFAAVLTALGVSLDVSLLHAGTVTVDNTEGRRCELAQAISDVGASRTLMKMDALWLQERVQFAAGQLYGRVARRVARRCLAIITQHACSAKNLTLSDSAIRALGRYRSLLTSGGPRVLSVKGPTCWYLFIDASHEPEADVPFAGMGAVLVDESGRKVRFFRQVPKRVACFDQCNVSQDDHI